MILEKEVEITVSSKVIEHYKKLNYNIYSRKETITVKVEHLPKGSGVLVTKVCDICGLEIKKQKYDRVIRLRKNNIDYCHKCALKKAIANRSRVVPFEKSLQYLYPKIAYEWDIEKNKIMADDIYASSNKKYYWNCQKCQSSYICSPNYRTLKNYGCPYCSRHKINHTNCLAFTHPELIKEWCFEKNDIINPHNISSGSGRLI